MFSLEQCVWLNYLRKECVMEKLQWIVEKRRTTLIGGQKENTETCFVWRDAWKLSGRGAETREQPFPVTGKQEVHIACRSKIGRLWISWTTSRCVSGMRRGLQKMRVQVARIRDIDVPKIRMHFAIFFCITLKWAEEYPTWKKKKEG